MELYLHTPYMPSWHSAYAQKHLYLITNTNEVKIIKFVISKIFTRFYIPSRYTHSY
jgi:hypothetical protein